MLVLFGHLSHVRKSYGELRLEWRKTSVRYHRKEVTENAFIDECDKVLQAVRKVNSSAINSAIVGIALVFFGVCGLASVASTPRGFTNGLWYIASLALALFGLANVVSLPLYRNLWRLQKEICDDIVEVDARLQTDSDRCNDLRENCAAQNQWTV